MALSQHISHKMMISLTPIVYKSKTKWYKLQNSKKLALNSQLQTYQIFPNDHQMLILRLSYSMITVIWILVTEICLEIENENVLKITKTKIKNSGKWKFHVLEEMTNASLLSEKKLTLRAHHRTWEKKTLVAVYY